MYKEVIPGSLQDFRRERAIFNNAREHLEAYTLPTKSTFSCGLQFIHFVSNNGSHSAQLQGK